MDYCTNWCDRWITHDTYIMIEKSSKEYYQIKDQMYRPPTFGLFIPHLLISLDCPIEVVPLTNHV